MEVFLNGRFVPEEQAVVSVFDRGFLYGDGLFETLRVYRGVPFCWEQHMERMRHGAELLRLQVPRGSAELRGFADELIRRNQMPESLLRITITRGVGQRGYSPKGAERPSLVMSLHPAPVVDAENPPQWKLMVSSVRVPAKDLITQIKTCNKLAQVLARSEADSAGAQEALLINTNDEIAEASSSNLFWVEKGVVCTPTLASGALPGVTRGLVLELCRQMDLPTREMDIRPGGLQVADAVFLSLTSMGIVEVTHLDDRELKRAPVVARIFHAYRALLES
jgi:aminodeoxychorismate lyase